MTISANRTPQLLTPEAARATLTEMSAVIRAIFGAGLRAPRQVPEAAAPPPGSMPAGADVAGRATPDLLDEVALLDD